MFNKPFKVKSNSATKGTDKKKLQRRLAQMFPMVTDSTISSMVPSKMAVQTVRLVTHSEQIVSVYVVDGEPMFVDNDGFVFPTVYTLWRWPHILGYVTTWSPVLKKLQNGAALMLPGVILPENGGMDFTSLEKEQLCAVNVANNRCAVCVGITTMSGQDMLASEMKGKGVTILHCYGDQLWALGSKSDLPHLTMPVMDTLEDLESSFNAQMRHKLTASGDTSLTQHGHDNESEEFMSHVSLKLDSLRKDEEFDLTETSPLQELGSLPSCNVNITANQTDDSDAAVATNIPLGNLFGDEEDDGDFVEDVTDVLTDITAQLSRDGQLLEDKSEVSEASCTISELVVHAPDFSLLESTTPMGTIYSNDTTTPPVEHDPKKVTHDDLPLLTSTFYKAHMIPSCPEGLTLDVKKSSYKKLSKFLEEMQLKGIIEVKELSKGVESIVSFDKKHSDLKSYKTLSGMQQQQQQCGEKSDDKTSEQHVIITELVMPSAQVLPLFGPRKISKERYLKPTDAKEVLTSYVRAQDLVDKDNNRLLILDPLLCDVLRKKGSPPDEKLSWQEATQRLIELMRPAYCIQWPGRDPVYKKGKLQPVKLTVTQRASNKKVTLVDNLECYGISPVDFAHSMQKLAAASTTTTQLPGKSAGMQALVQGNTAKLASNIIHDQYGVPQKYIEIADTVKHKTSTHKKHK
ncbi:eukaryotic translation initiation factor 2D-like isoform X2 [Dysidea avara]|uniref:eukaryotic translation initiation factor 2D-like isoform X2 n=1 Tax=Dysidea avara TaxID=196820 RepID=UPI00331E369E